MISGFWWEWWDPIGFNRLMSMLGDGYKVYFWSETHVELV